MTYKIMVAVKTGADWGTVVQEIFHLPLAHRVATRNGLQYPWEICKILLVAGGTKKTVWRSDLGWMVPPPEGLS